MSIMSHPITHESLIGETLNYIVDVSPEVRQALKVGRSVVALDSTIYGEAGLGSVWPEFTDEPSEQLGPGETCLLDVTKQLSFGGVEPAVTAIIEGKVKVGLDEVDYPGMLATSNKAGIGDLNEVISGSKTATTTISSALWLAEKTGIKVLATSGIGGVHVDHSDRSSDIGALAEYSVVTVAAGMKTFLDREATLAALQELKVPVVGWRTNDCPSFYSRNTGIVIPQVNSAQEVVELSKSKWTTGSGGMLVAVPIPQEFDIPLSELQPIIDQANGDIARRGITGPAVTPEVLKYMRHVLGNRLVRSNLALAKQNAAVAAEIALAFAG
jgi:pseudouridine-5'-phosphate glycosidase